MQVSPRRFIASSFTLSVVLERRSFSMSTLPSLQLIPFSSNIKICSSPKLGMCASHEQKQRLKAACGSTTRQECLVVSVPPTRRTSPCGCAAQISSSFIPDSKIHIQLAPSTSRSITGGASFTPPRVIQGVGMTKLSFFMTIFCVAYTRAGFYSDVEFDLSSSKNGERHTRKYKGVWIMVDNGYLRCPSHRQQYCHY